MSSLKGKRSSKTKAGDAGKETRAPGPRLPEVVIGRLSGFDAEGAPLVTYPGCARPNGVPAMSASPVSKDDIGREAALLFADGDPARPFIVGLLQPSARDLHPSAALARAPEDLAETGQRDRVVLTADREIVLTCGKSSLTLTRAGKILLRGAYLLSRSSGVNRIKGGSVQIN